MSVPVQASLLESIYKRVKREIVIHRQLKHPHVVGFLGAFRDNTPHLSAPLIVLPYLPKRSAKAWIEQHPTPLNYLRIVSSPLLLLLGFHILIQGQLSDVAEGLEYLHSRSPPVIHGDLHGVKSKFLGNSAPN